MKSLVALTVGAGLCALASPAYSWNSELDELMRLPTYGEADGWVVKKIDSEDIWMGQACLVFKRFDASAEPPVAGYRFDPEEPRVDFSYSYVTQQHVPNPDDIDWGALEPADFDYAVDGSDEIFTAAGYIGVDYVDSQRIRVNATFELDQAGVDRIAGSEMLGLRRSGDEGGGTVSIGRSARAVEMARRCVGEFR